LLGVPQAYYLNAPLPCERAPTSHLKGLKRQHRGDVTVSRLVDYPVRGFVIEGGSLQDMADVVGQAALVLQAHNIPHNALISDCGQRVFLFPQAYAERQARGEVEEELLATGEGPGWKEERVSGRWGVREGGWASLETEGLGRQHEQAAANTNICRVPDTLLNLEFMDTHA
jgi:hypothetical protein